MRKVEEALKTKGYDPGKIDGVVDDANRAAIRSFQKDKSLPITGTVDNRTAEELGVRISKASDRTGTKGTPQKRGVARGEIQTTLCRKIKTRNKSTPNFLRRN